MARRLSSPVFIGRSSELHALLATADTVASGHTAVTLVGGEAGVGKSRLVAELAGQLRDRDWLVLQGGSVAVGDDGLPFGPIVEALRALSRDVEPERIAAAAGAGLPELARLVPELANAPDPTPVADSQADWLQVRIFEGILRLLGRLGDTSPVLLIVEDAHWADRSTRDLLAFLVRSGREERLFIVTTYRTDELHRRHPLTGWLAEADRQPRVERIDLARFERDELVEMIGMIAGDQLGPALVESIARRSDGNAFFAEELVAATDSQRSNHDGLPETLRGVLLVRLAAATEDAGRLVEIAAVAGRQVEHDVLAEVCGLSEADLSRALHEALDAQLLFVDRAGASERYAFRHALVQEAAYDQLLPSERRVLHGAYARAIEARPAGAGAAQANRLVELAHHYAAAQESRLALQASLGAADASRTVFAFAEAARQYERATELWDVVPAADRPAGRDLADVFDSAAAAAIVIGDASRAVSLARKAIEVVDAGPDTVADRERRARAREQLGFASWLAGDTATSIRRLEEAVELLEGTPASTEQARVLARLAANLMLAGRSAHSIPFAERAIETARTVGEAGIESRAMNTLGVDRATLGNISAGIELLRASLAIARPVDDPTEVPRAYANLGSVLEMGGFPEEALTVCLEGAELTRRYGSDLSFRIFLRVNAAAMLIELGRYAEAAELLEGQLPNVLPGVSTIQLHDTWAHLSLRVGDLAEARRHLEISRVEASGIDDAQYVIDLNTFGTEIALWDGDPATAVGIARDAFARLVDVDDAIILGQLTIPAAHAAADLAVRARAGRDPAAAEEAVLAARAVIDRYRASTERLTDPDILAQQQIGWRMALCEAELARAAGADDPAAWLAVRPALATRPAPFLEAYVLWRAAEAFADGGEHAAAADPLREAYAIASRIGAGLLVTGIETTGRRLRVSVAPPDTRLTVREEEVALEPADPFGLTTREREVLTLVAEGYTNKRIAETLFISESTAGVHVSNILGKLGVATRTEAAAVAVRLGLDKAVVRP